VDLVLTSPPYPSTYDYVLMQQLRMAWLGDIPRQDAEIGSRKSWRQLGKRKARAAWDSDTQRWTRQAAKALRPGGHMVVVIGDGLTPNGVVDTSKISEASAQQAGLESVARASVARPDHARQTLRWEHAFAFRRPEG
jgi:DNA modification methylase